MSVAYRYNLSRIVREPDLLSTARRRVVFCMLNPSTAEEDIHGKNDPTVRRCIGYAFDWHYTDMEVVNAFAARSTDPDALLRMDDPVGPSNDAAIRAAMLRSDLFIAAWGGHKSVKEGRQDAIVQLARECGIAIYALKVNGDGTPAHPLYLSKMLEPVLWR